MFSALLILFPLSYFHTLNVRSNRYRPFMHFLFWIFIANFFFLMWLGGKPAYQPFVFLSQFATILYFSYFFILMIIG